MKTYIGLRLDPDILEQVDRIIQARPGIENRNQCLRYLIRKGIDEEEQGDATRRPVEQIKAQV